MFGMAKHLDIIQGGIVVKRTWNPWMGGGRADCDKACCFFVAVGGLDVLFGALR